MKFNIDATLTKNYFISFIIGLMSAFPSLAPTAISLKRFDRYDLYKEAGFETKFLWIPIAYGILHIIILEIMNKLFPPILRKFWVLGIIIGLIYPTLGTIDDYAKRIYKIKSYYNLYFNALLLYIPFYTFVINFIFTNICS